MKEPEDDSLMKSRSARSVVAAAFRLFSGNFRRLFRASWPSATVYAVVNSVLGTIVVVALPPVVIALMADPMAASRLGVTYLSLLGLVALFVVVGGLAELMFYSVGIDMLRVHGESGKMPLTSRHFPLKTFWRLMKGGLSILLVELPFVIAFAALYHFKLASVIGSPDSHIVLWAAVGIAFVVVALLELPLFYVAMCYVMKGELKFWQSLPSSYKSGISHLGHIFVVVLINAIVLVVAHYIITQPAVILEVTNVSANVGAVMGDPLGMPSYMTWLCAITFLIAGFMQAFIRMTLVFSLYYMYGAIETVENEKKQFKETIQQ